MFVKGIATVRTLSAAGGGLSRPPAETRAELYGLYKQATEGDVEGLMERPIGDELSERKWDAWKSFEGIKPTESKKRYIMLLIETMRSYASSTPQARELLSELETMWDQVRELSPTSQDSSSPLFGNPGSIRSMTRLSLRGDDGDVGGTAAKNHLHSNATTTNLHQQHHHNRSSTNNNNITTNTNNNGGRNSPFIHHHNNSSGLRISKPDLDDAELQRWKREISRALETLNEEVLTLRSRVSELSSQSHNGVSSNRFYKFMCAVLSKVWKVFWPTAKRITIDGSIVLATWYAVQWIRRNPTKVPLLSNALAIISTSMMHMLYKLDGRI